VALVGDIDRGHVIAALVGAHAVLDAEDRAMIKGFLINRFRGDPALFDEGRRQIAHRTGWRDLGMAPWLDAAGRLPAEDAVVLERGRPIASGGKLRIVAPRWRSLANFDDFDPLRADPAIDFAFIPPGTPLPGDADLVVLPGSKAVLSDLAMMRSEGWDIDLAAHVRHGGRVLGLCGGYQMLGRRIADPLGVEGAPGSARGLGLLDVETILTAAKTLQPAAGRLVATGEPVTGYEIHVGETLGPGAARPFLVHADGRPDGAVSPDGRIAGTYVHGLFDGGEARAAILRPLGGLSAGGDHGVRVEAALDEIAGILAGSLDINAIVGMAGL
jgi:adenosylcobyric acid synthase